MRSRGPLCKGDQFHAPSSHSTSASNIAPKAVENGTRAKVAPVKARRRNSAGSINGLPARRQCTDEDREQDRGDGEARQTPANSIPIR